MRIKIIKEIFKKEILDIVRDRKSIFMMIVVPILLYPIIMVLLMGIMNSSINKMTSETITLGLSSAPNAEFVEIVDSENAIREKEDTLGNIEIKTNIKDYKSELEKGEIDAYIDNSIKDNDYKVIINSASDESGIKSDAIFDVMNKYKRKMSEREIEKHGLDSHQILEPIKYEKVDITNSAKKAGMLLGQVIPFILIIGVLFGSIYPAIDVMAGEKERGTLETLFSLPISNMELVIGKYMAVSASAILTSLLNIISMSCTLGYFMKAESIYNPSMMHINYSVLGGAVLITVVSVILFAQVVSALAMCVCSFAKTFKEAQNYITPLMLIIMVPAYISMIPNISLSRITATIPVVNISLLIKSVISLRANMKMVSLVLIVNLIFVLISLVLLSKIFNSEDILFGEKRNFKLIQSRSSIKEGSMPGISDGFMVYVLAFISLIYVSPILNMKLGIMGNTINQFIMALIPILVAVYIKADFKKLFSIKKIKIKDIIRAAVTWFVGSLIMSVFVMILLKLFPDQMKVSEQLNEIIKSSGGLFTQIILFALVPAICEEILFRGFVLSAFRDKKTFGQKNEKHIVFAIVVSGILFGIMHLDFIRIIPTSILGMVMAYNVYKSKSIFTSVGIHFFNNLLSVLSVNFGVHAMLLLI
ncbi:ABC transporter permease subunit/CPBP intramembrane protease [Peptacetobacter sp.]|uniref:ABC transporter permease subunit/CPBP intramembrane protease n=1 Tax=Peptacetobacter sp. TaxID=2991975 RepID=UPI002E75EF9D|nr:ABC transporter permease subunit/CPBP intramembrane protease [Peptacetobacter sp.]MEE0452267.1 ABC transporter permease subunit/CPBP intramembrane protease [Peptacetobacter sp.]